jgi:perosamine synthetase
MQADYLPFALPDLDQTELHEIKEVLDSGWLTTGAKTRRFEQEFAAFVGAPHAVAVNSCTAAMHLALEAIGLCAGDLVLTSPYTFAATAEVIRYFGAIPVFVDVEPDTLNIDAVRLTETVEALMAGSPAARRFLPPALRNDDRPHPLKAIMPVHLAGHPCELEAIYDLAERHSLAVIEDAAHAFGTTYKDLPIGCPRSSRVKSAVCFSFYATKCLTTGEGGMLCSADPQLVDRCRMMALHGINKDAWKRYSSEGTWVYEIVAPGFKYNLTDLAAALGLAQLRKAERMRQRRLAIARQYDDAFRRLPELQVPYRHSSCQHAWHLYMLRLEPDRLRIDRARLVEALKARGIGTSVHFIPLHSHPYYRETYGYRPDDLPIAYREFQREISLPIYSKMSDGDVARVIQAIEAIVSQHRMMTCRIESVVPAADCVPEPVHGVT